MKLTLSQSRVLSAWLFILPMLIVLVSVAGWPLMRTLWMAFTDARLDAFHVPQWIGLENFIVQYGDNWFGILADPIWWNAVRNTLYFTIVSVFFTTILGTIIALVLDTPFKGRTILRASVLIPWAIPSIISAKMWAWILHDQFGIFNSILMSIGWIDAPKAWTADATLAMHAIIFIEIWRSAPFMALLILAGLQMVPKDCYEAAKVDGIPAWLVFWKVTLPLIMPAITVAVIFRILDGMRVFDLIYVLTPNNEQTMSMASYARQHMIEFQSAGYGSAASTLLFFMVSLVTIGYIAISKKKLEVQ
ncbi:sugar ABC transporter permease [Vibrio kyushuensis]|uniref:carbohydrate ABC transporter permease n=1 Tax=Vibrio kyushuensis TaxID=2910249 RepID=UPI003D1088E4